MPRTLSVHHGKVYSGQFRETSNDALVYIRFEELGLISRCKVLEGVKAELSDIERVHPPETIELLKTISSVTDVNEQERHASKYDAIYFDKVR